MAGTKFYLMTGQSSLNNDTTRSVILILLTPQSGNTLETDFSEFFSEA